MVEGSARGSGGPFLSRYGTLLKNRSFVALLISGATAFSAPSMIVVILSFSITISYPAADRGSYAALALAFLGLSATVPTLASAFVSGTLADRIPSRRVNAIRQSRQPSRHGRSGGRVRRSTRKVPFRCRDPRVSMYRSGRCWSIPCSPS